MKTKTVLVTLFLFAFGASLSEAVVNEVRRPSFFYGPPPYEFGYSQPEEQLRPTYMPREFGIRPEEQAIITPAPEPAPFVPTPPEIEVAAAPAPEPESAVFAQSPPETDTDGFIPFEYARARYSDNVPPPIPAWMEAAATPRSAEAPAPATLPPSSYETEDSSDGFMSYEYARRRFAN